jgi:hypothetical protein
MPNVREAFWAILVFCLVQALVFRQNWGETTTPTTAAIAPTFPSAKEDDDGHALRACTQNPYLNALEPLGGITTEMDRWLGNVSAIGSQSTAA